MLFIKNAIKIKKNILSKAFFSKKAKKDRVFQKTRISTFHSHEKVDAVTYSLTLFIFNAKYLAGSKQHKLRQLAISKTALLEHYNELASLRSLLQAQFKWKHMSDTHYTQCRSEINMLTLKRRVCALALKELLYKWCDLSQNIYETHKRPSYKAREKTRAALWKLETGVLGAVEF